MLLAWMITANLAEIDAAIAVRHLRVSGLLPLPAGACSCTHPCKSCAAKLELSRGLTRRGASSIKEPWNVSQARLRLLRPKPAGYLKARNRKDSSELWGVHNRMQGGLPQAKRRAGAQCALVSCSAPALTPASDHRKHCLHFWAAALLPVPHHPAVRCRPVQMSVYKPSAMLLYDRTAMPWMAA